MPFCQAVHRPPIIGRLHHKPHHAMFSADPAPCPCVSNGQPVIKDGFLKDDAAKGNQAMSGPIIKGLDVNGSETYFPANYGNTCESWDQITDPVCKEKYPPAYCQTRWCFVAPECAKSDTQSTWRFPGSELYFSYEACGSFDATSSYKCHVHNTEFKCAQDVKESHYKAQGPRCEWLQEIKNKELPIQERLCQPERCRCTGDFLSTAGADEKEGLYGTKCAAWDRKKCEEWQNEPGAKMGIWCCQSWCYVDASCPSAAPSVDKPGLYYSYVACKDDLKELKQCPWQEATGWQGSPALLSDRARTALAERKPPEPPKKDSWTDDVFPKTWSDEPLYIGIIIACLILVLLICVIMYCCCKPNPT